MASPKQFVIGFEFQNRDGNPAVHIVHFTSQMRTERNS